MKKTIKIGGRDYFMKSSAYTQFKYRDETGRRLLDDIQKLSHLNELSEDEQIAQTDDLIELLLRIAYIMIQEADENQVGTFEEFLKGIDGLFEETAWIYEVIELAASPISRGLQGNPQNK